MPRIPNAKVTATSTAQSCCWKVPAMLYPQQSIIGLLGHHRHPTYRRRTGTVQDSRLARLSRNGGYPQLSVSGAVQKDHSPLAQPGTATRCPDGISIRKRIHLTLNPFALLTATGMRRSELLNCRWKFLEGSRILLPTSKNEEPKEVHLNTFAEKVLASISQREPEVLLFPNVTPEAVSMAFRRVCKMLGIVDIRLHDLCHTFATWLRQRGTEPDVIASQLGHRDLRMTKRYARVASSQVRQAVNGLDSMFGASPEAEMSDISHPLVTAKPPLT